MNKPNFVLFYVEDLEASAQLYSQVLNREPVESSPNYKRFALDSGLLLSLLSKQSAEPKADFKGASGELVFTMASKEEMESTLQAWSQKGMTVIQNITSLPWGSTFTVEDPDGHRLRCVLDVD